MCVTTHELLFLGETESFTSDILNLFPDEDESLSDVLHLGRDLGIKEVEGQRVTQVSH